METTTRQLRTDAANWWLYLLGGLGMLWLGFVAFQNPATAYLGLSLYFAATIFLNGLMGAIFAASNRQRVNGWVWVLLAGVLEALLGLYLLVAPGAAAGTFAFVIGFWLVYRSSTTIANAFMLRQLRAAGWGWVLAAGIAGLLLSFVVLANPLVGVAGAAVWLAVSLFVLGIGLLALAFWLRSAKPQLASTGSAA